MSVLLLRGGKSVAYVRMELSGGSGLAAECRALTAMALVRNEYLWTPSLMVSGDWVGWSYAAFTPLPDRRPHRRPRAPDLDVLCAEVQEGLASWSRDRDTPSHWTPIHGDFTPWNLRESHDGTLYLLDWENADWGPPGADKVLYQATEAALGNVRPQPSEFREAIGFWEGRIHEQQDRGRDKRLAEGIHTALAKMKGSGQ